MTTQTPTGAVPPIPVMVSSGKIAADVRPWQVRLWDDARLLRRTTHRAHHISS